MRAMRQMRGMQCDASRMSKFHWKTIIFKISIRNDVLKVKI